MDMVPVESSAISHIGYDPDAKTMAVKWKHGETTRYANVPDYVHAGAMRSKSIGAYVRKYIVGTYKVISNRR